MSSAPELTSPSRETVALVRALMERDSNTGEHCKRTHALSLELGKAAALSAGEIANLALAARLHDIGKIGIPDSVLLKRGRLEPDELAVMRTHPRRGYEILAVIPDDDHAAVAEAVLRHHECFDGSGYPDGLKGEEVPGLYHDYVRHGDAWRLVPVFHHNLLDVITMAELLAALCGHDPARSRSGRNPVPWSQGESLTPP